MTRDEALSTRSLIDNELRYDATTASVPQKVAALHCTRAACSAAPRRAQLLALAGAALAALPPDPSPPLGGFLLSTSRGGASVATST